MLRSVPFALLLLVTACATTPEAPPSTTPIAPDEPVTLRFGWTPGLVVKATTTKRVEVLGPGQGGERASGRFALVTSAEGEALIVRRTGDSNAFHGVDMEMPAL